MSRLDGYRTAPDGGDAVEITGDERRRPSTDARETLAACHTRATTFTCAVDARSCRASAACTATCRVRSDSEVRLTSDSGSTRPIAHSGAARATARADVPSTRHERVITGVTTSAANRAVRAPRSTCAAASHPDRPTSRATAREMAECEPTHRRAGACDAARTAHRACGPPYDAPARPVNDARRAMPSHPSGRPPHESARHAAASAARAAGTHERDARGGRIRGRVPLVLPDPADVAVSSPPCSR